MALLEPDDCSACEGVDCTAEPPIGGAADTAPAGDPAFDEVDRGLLELGVAELELLEPDDCSDCDGVD